MDAEKMIPKIPGLNFGGGYEESSSDQLSSNQNATSSARGAMLNFGFDSGVNFASKKAGTAQWVAIAVTVSVVGLVLLRVLRQKKG